MKTRLALSTLLFLCLSIITQAAVPVVTNVACSQQVSNKLVNITYDVFDVDGDALNVRVELSYDGGTNYNVPAFTFTGDIGEGVSTGANKLVVWDAGADWDGEYSDQMRAKVIASDAQGLPGLEWSSEIPAGGFLMGQDGGAEGSGPSVHVNITNSYWLSKYEIRNDQYAEFLNMALAVGDVYRVGVASVHSTNSAYAGVPDDSMLIYIGDTYDLRWNVNHFETCEDRTNFPVRVTWYGAIAFAQHYGYDLPTEAEWEKAVRGSAHEDEGSHLVYSWGDVISSACANFFSSGDLSETNDSSRWTTPVGYYDGTQTPAGVDMANDYGLYDMNGNVFEWCRSEYISSVEDYPQLESLTNSINIITTTVSRVVRGGSWGSEVTSLRNYSRYGCNQSWVFSGIGGWENSPQRSGLGIRVVRRQE